MIGIDPDLLPVLAVPPVLYFYHTPHHWEHLLIAVSRGAAPAKNTKYSSTRSGERCMESDLGLFLFHTREYALPDMPYCGEVKQEKTEVAFFACSAAAVLALFYCAAGRQIAGVSELRTHSRLKTY